MVSSKLWTEEEIDYLRSHFFKMSIQEISEKLGRSNDGVKGKASSLGLRKTAKWTEDDDIYLEYFIFENDEKIKEAADFLNRSIGAVYTRLNTLRNRDNLVGYAKKRWTIKEKEFVKNNYLTMTVKKIGDRLGKTEAAVAYQMRQLGLRKAKSIDLYDAEIRRVAAEGYYLRQASRILNIGHSSLYSYCQRENIEFRKTTGDETIQKLRELMQKEYKRAEHRHMLKTRKYV